MKISQELQDALIVCGVDHDILNGILEDMIIGSQSNNQLAMTREFVKTAALSQIEWAKSFSDEESLDGAEVQMHKKWRPKETTLKIIIDHLKLDRIEVGYMREFFIELNLGKTEINWDIHFIFSATNGAILTKYNESVSTALAIAAADDPIKESAGERIDHINLELIRSAIREIMKSVYVTPLFNFQFRDDWQPKKWVVNKLVRIGINKKFIYGDHILKPYVSHMKNKHRTSIDYDIEYYHWVKSRFKKSLNFLLNEKNQLESQIKNEHRD